MNTDELERLMREATPGPWNNKRSARCIQGPDTFEGDPVIIGGLVGGSRQWSNFPFSEYCVPGKNEGDANAALICAAVNALPELVALRKENDRLREALKDVVERYDAEHPMRQADWHNLKCGCVRCLVDRARAALNQEPGQ